ncbi:TonB-dependent receptor [Aestuariicella hydrocarbonica]|uniref:TonB-dependent receptor n=1 Tax=Pseudomaricurvus hydrocarbonicus TaxID=1470433 RepID=A0A9E5JR48_9GAMM|nr:TonB-dependent receptor [Aestuariicella hydrocarbonica]NHO65163.1 TonB-dependent receptor [Aestuariicella hydrocarbonica]
MKSHNNNFRFRALSLAIACAASASFSYAATLEEVVVTATKRAESLQDVPISMIAMDGESIKDLGVTNAIDFAANMPAVTISETPIGNFVFIRGIGTPGTNQGIELSVSTFHDGIYMGRHQLARAPFMDLERVEVLRGPQSILFGKNTIGGAIHAITAKPTEEFEASISVLVGENSELEYTGVVSGGLTDSLRGRLAYRAYETDGYFDNVMTGEDEVTRDDYSLRGQLAFDLTDNIMLTGKWETGEFNADGKPVQLAVFDALTPGAQQISGLNQLLVAAATGGNGIERYDDERAVINDGGALLGQVVPSFEGVPGFPEGDEFSDNEMDLGTFTVEWILGDHTLTAITGYAQYEYQDVCDCDFSALPLIEVDAAEDYEQWSQEIRLTSPGGETLDYILGAYYHQSDLEYSSIEQFGAALAGAPNVSRAYRMTQDQDQWAIFGSGTWNFTELTRMTVGLRYSEESKEASHVLEKSFTGGWDFGGGLVVGDTAADYDAFEAAFPGVAGALDAGLWQGLLGTYEHDIRGRERDEEFVSWSINLEHDLTPDVMVFATVSTGVKGGGFDARFLRENDNPFFEYEEEEALNIELGVKSTLLDGAMTLNATVFQTTVEDYQVSIFDGATAFFVQNAAEIESRGLEVDLRWQATDNLTVGFAGSYLKAEYTDFENAPCWAVQSVADPVGCATNGRDASGDPNLFSPEYAANLNLDYHLPLGDTLEFRATWNINYSDEYFNAGDLDPRIAMVDSYTKHDLRLAIGAADGQWDVALLGRNLTDEFTSGNSNDQPLVPGNGFAQLDLLRTYAVQGTYRF